VSELEGSKPRRLGAGMGYRRRVKDEILANHSEIDWLEIITEHYLGMGEGHTEELQSLRENFPLIPHGLELSIGTPGPLDGTYLDALAKLVESVAAPWCSDHLCFTRTEEVSLGQLTPIPRTRDTLDQISKKVTQVAAAVGVPFLLENITYPLEVGGELSEPQFITELAERTGCGLLLDLTNVVINATNHHFSYEEWLQEIPLDAVVQIHLAGGHEVHGRMIDSHAHPVPEEVWSALRFVCGKTFVSGVMIERDDDFPTDFSELTREVARARDILEKDSAGVSEAAP
jgi:uncharacterized protein